MSVVNFSFYSYRILKQTTACEWDFLGMFWGEENICFHYFHSFRHFSPPICFFKKFSFPTFRHRQKYEKKIKIMKLNSEKKKYVKFFSFIIFLGNRPIAYVYRWTILHASSTTQRSKKAYDYYFLSYFSRQYPVLRFVHAVYNFHRLVINFSRRNKN